jgi:hypothetical protein
MFHDDAFAPITSIQFLAIASWASRLAGSQSVLSAIVLLLFYQNWYKYAVFSQDYGLLSQDCGS